LSFSFRGTGILGVIIDWYDPNASQENATTLAMASEAQSRNGAFRFAIMEEPVRSATAPTPAVATLPRRLSPS
jgi:hypothetical protein